VTEPRWRIRLSDEAEQDFLRILKDTKDAFGERQSIVYRALLLDGLAALDAGPDVPGSSARDELRPHLHSLHVARRGRSGRHVIIYRAGGGNVIDVVRILHDAMDFARHLPAEST
jgi:toxin ParE1/3/4